MLGFTVIVKIRIYTPAFPFFYDITGSIYFFALIDIEPILTPNECRLVIRSLRGEWRRRGRVSGRVAPRLDHFRTEACVMTVKNLSCNNKITTDIFKAIDTWRVSAAAGKASCQNELWQSFFLTSMCD